jgi:hypothetical protein
MAEKKTKLDLKGLKNLFGTKKSSINMDDKNEDPNFDTENSHLDDVKILETFILIEKLFFRTKNLTASYQKERVMKVFSRTFVSLTRKNPQMISSSF